MKNHFAANSDCFFIILINKKKDRKNCRILNET